MRRAALGLIITCCLPTQAFADGDEDLGQIYAEQVAGGGVATAGVGLSGRFDGVRNMTGTLVLTDVPTGASIEQAWLYWSTWLEADNDPTFAGQALTGTQIGTSADTGWSAGASSFAFRADVTALVSGNGNYLLEALQSSPLNGDANGAGLLVVYSDPNAATSATIVVSDGARTWCANGAFSEDFAGFTLPETPTAATFGLHVADGQAMSGMVQLFDSTLVFGTLSTTATFDANDGGMWDRDTFDVLAELDASSTTASWTYQNDGNDCVQFVSSFLDIRWPDADGDLTSDATDNCPMVANPAQTDSNGDGIGDACSMPMPPDMGPDMASVDLGPDMASTDMNRPDFRIDDINRDLGTYDLGSNNEGAPDAAGLTMDMRTISQDTAAETPDTAARLDGKDGCCSSVRSRPMPKIVFWVVVVVCAGRRRKL